MQIVTLTAGKEGRTRFGTMEVESDRFDYSGRVAPGSLMPTTGTRFIEFTEPIALEWHAAPRRQFVTVLRGGMEIEAGDGTLRQFGPGDVVMVDDQGSRGHRTRSLGDDPLVLMFAHLE